MSEKNQQIVTQMHFCDEVSFLVYPPSPWVKHCMHSTSDSDSVKSEFQIRAKQSRSYKKMERGQEVSLKISIFMYHGRGIYFVQEFNNLTRI